MQTIKKRINNIELNVYRILKILKHNVNSDPCPVINEILPNKVPASNKDEEKEHEKPECLSSYVSRPSQRNEYNTPNINNSKDVSFELYKPKSIIPDRTLLTEEEVAQFKDDTGSRDKNVLKLSRSQKKKIKKKAVGDKNEN